MHWFSCVPCCPPFPLHLTISYLLLLQGSVGNNFMETSHLRLIIPTSSIHSTLSIFGSSVFCFCLFGRISLFLFCLRHEEALLMMINQGTFFFFYLTQLLNSSLPFPTSKHFHIPLITLFHVHGVLYHSCCRIHICVCVYF